MDLEMAKRRSEEEQKSVSSESKPSMRALTTMVKQPGSSAPPVPPTTPPIQSKVSKSPEVDYTMQQLFFGTKLEVLKLLSIEDSPSQSPVSHLVTLSKQKEKLSLRKEKLGPIYLDI